MSASTSARLAFIRVDHGHLAVEFGRQSPRRRGRGIEHDTPAVPPRQPGGMRHDIHGNIELHQEHVRGHDRFRLVVDIVTAEQQIRAGRHDGRIVAAGVHRVMSATPDATRAAAVTCVTSIPSACRPARRSRPKASSPTVPTMATAAPRRAAATA